MSAGNRWSKYDVYGQELFPGDVCARSVDNKVELIVYKGTSWGGSNSTGAFGRFITPSGLRSIKFTSVIFAFDPMGERRAKAEIVSSMVRTFYEGKK